MKTYTPIWSSMIVEMQEFETTASWIISMWATDEALAVAKWTVISIWDWKVDGKVIESPVAIWDTVVFSHHAWDKISKKIRVLGFRQILAIENK